jgi:hypothetical protein
VFSALEGKRMGKKQSREQNSGTINTSTTQSARPHETSGLKEPKKWAAAATGVGERP